MQKTTTARLLTYYLWLAETIYSRGPISRERINELWSRATINDEGENSIPESTFHRWRIAAETLLHINILCDSNGRYYIDDKEYLQKGFLSYLFNSFAVNNLLHDNINLRKQILFEDVPSGQQFLTTIIEALRDKRTISITHQSFKQSKQTTFEVEPYCLKMFKQRWYMLANSPHIKEIRTYSLDRIQAVEMTEKTYSIPAYFDAENYFRNNYGVSGIHEKPTIVKIKVKIYQANYLRTLPLHPSQQEIERNDDYSVFTFHIVPSYEFQQELRKYGSEIEVLEPQWLRRQFRHDAKNNFQQYEQ